MSVTGGPVRLRSELAHRLEREIAAATATPVRCAVLQAQRAILWLRHGHEVEARKELIRLQGCVLRHPNVELAAWLHLAEGLAAYFSSFGSGARDRVRRAGVMAEAAKLRPLQTLAEAWLAQIDFVNRDIEGFIKHIKVALNLLEPFDKSAGYRVATAVASAWGFAVGGPIALRWWEFARRQALQEGDGAGLSALFYNQTQMRALRIRDNAFGVMAAAEPAELLGIDSVGNYDGAIGGSVRSDLTPLLRAQLLTVQGDYLAAATLLEAHLPEAMSSGLARVGGSMLGDLALCWANVGELHRARALADQSAVEVLAEDSQTCNLDERAALHARLAQVYLLLGEEGLAARHAVVATDARAQDAAQRCYIAEQMMAAGLSEPPR